MGYADARVCPSCRGPIEQAITCPHCGLDLTTHDVQQAWQALVVADQWIERAKSLHAAGVPAETGPPLSATAQAPQHPASAAPPSPRRRVSTGSVLLGLGTIAILVAGIIFISVSWDSLGVVGRALVLLAVTALFGVAARFVTRRGLRASAEALWSVFLGLLTLDWFAARGEGLLGLDAWPFGVSAASWAVLMIITALVVVPMGRGRLGKELLAPSIAAGVAGWFAAGGLAAELPERIANEGFWPAVLATVVAVVAALALRRGSVRVGAWISFAGAAFFGLFSVGFAIVEAFEHPALTDLTVDAHGLPLLIVVIAAVAVGVVVTRARWASSAVAVAGAATLVILPIEEAWPERGGFVAVAAFVAVVAWTLARAGDWFRGARLAATVAAFGLALASAPWVGRLLAVVAEGASSTRADDVATRLRPDDAPEVGPWWVATLVALGLAAALAGARRWPESGEVRAHVAPAAWCTGVVGAWAVLATFDPAAGLLGGSLVAGGALFAVVLPSTSWWRWVGPAVVTLAPISTISSWPAAIIVWPAAGLVLAAIAMRTGNVLVRCAAAFAATAWGLGTVAPALELLDGNDRWTALALVVAAVVGLGVALFAVRDDMASLAVEAAAATLGAVGITVGSVDSTLGFTSFLWTVAGAGVVVLGLASSRRRWHRWAGSALLGVAYVLRLAASDVDVVEAYTLPFAALLLGAGLWAMREENGPGSVRALLPGMALAMLPSLPQALDEPTGLRALLLGLGAAVALAVGTWRRWQVPFVAGAAVLTILVLVNVAPLTREVPLVVLVATIGLVSLGAGFTWDDRVRDGRAVVRYVGSMR